MSILKPARSSSVPRDPCGHYASLIRERDSNNTAFPAKSRPLKQVASPSSELLHQCICAPSVRPGSYRCRLHRGSSQSFNKRPRAGESSMKKKPGPLEASQRVNYGGHASSNRAAVATSLFTDPRDAGPAGVTKSMSRLSLRELSIMNARQEQRRRHTLVHASTESAPSQSSSQGLDGGSGANAGGTSEPSMDMGPSRFLRFAMSAGAAAAAIGVGAAAMKKFREDKSLSAFDALGPDVPPAAAASGLGPDGDVKVTVQPGDTLETIAQRLGTTPQILKEANGLKGDDLKAGEKLWVPKTYTIAKGDTVYKIARENNTNVAAILAINTIKNPDLIYPGDILLLP